MQQSIEVKLHLLNDLYHKLIKGSGTELDKTAFVSLVGEIRTNGFRFSVGVPDTNFALLPLDSLEMKLYVRLNLIQSLKRDAITEELFWYATYLRDCEKLLKRLIHVNLCKRGILGQQYFILSKGGRIDFMQSGDIVDLYVLWQNTANSNSHA